MTLVILLIKFRFIVHIREAEMRCEIKLKWRIIMWTTPAATEMRFGFEVTMYVMNK